jgi:hypothetical protein
MSDDRRLAMRLLKSFGHFWWDFLVGDTPEITVAVVVIVGAVALLADALHVNALAYVVLPLLVITALALSLYRTRKTG